MSTRRMRSEWVDQANHSLGLEGLTVTAEYTEDSQKYVVGEISANELVRITRERYGLSNSGHDPYFGPHRRGSQ